MISAIAEKAATEAVDVVIEMGELQTTLLADVGNIIPLTMRIALIWLTGTTQRGTRRAGNGAMASDLLGATFGATVGTSHSERQGVTMSSNTGNVHTPPPPFFVFSKSLLQVSTSEIR